jgi:membrane protease YdiL (CAAX protease family)
MILASGICFGLAHIFFFNVWALSLSTVGGFIFAWTYNRTGSIVYSGIEHGLWGDFIFTIGLGIYFYSGAITAV